MASRTPNRTPDGPADDTRATLLSRVRDPSDERAWREFDERYRELILRYGRRRGLQPANAEDVRQLVMLGLSKSLRSFKYDPARGRFRDYLGRVVRNAVTRFVSCPNDTAGSLQEHELERLADPAGDRQDETWEREWVEHHFRRAMAKAERAFEPKCLDVFRHLLAGESTEEVATAFDMTTAAVHKVKQRVRDHLRARIDEQIRDEGE